MDLVTRSDSATTEIFESNSTVFVESKIAEGIWKYGSIVLIIVGTVGNILAICILLRRNMRSTTTMFYLTVLAFADIFVLYTGLFRQWMKYTYNDDFRLRSSVSCSVHLFLVYCSLDVAVWTLVVVTVDRAIFVCSPFRAKTLCTLRNARITLAILILIVILLNNHFLWMFGLVSNSDGVLDCGISTTISPRQYWFAEKFHPWLDFCKYSFFPFSIMLVCNALIIRQMALSRSRLLAHFKREEERVNAGQIQVTTRPRAIPKRPRRVRCSSVTVTLLTVNIVFLCTTLPVVIFLVGDNTWFQQGQGHGRAVWKLLWAIVNMLQYLNNAIHFFLFCLTGPKFRRELHAMFRRKTKIGVFVEASTTLEMCHTNTQHR